MPGHLEPALAAPRQIGGHARAPHDGVITLPHLAYLTTVLLMAGIDV